MEVCEKDKYVVRARFAVSRHSSRLIHLPSFLSYLSCHSCPLWPKTYPQLSSPASPVLCGLKHIPNSPLLPLLFFVADNLSPTLLSCLSYSLWLKTSPLPPALLSLLLFVAYNLLNSPLLPLLLFVAYNLHNAPLLFLLFFVAEINSPTSIQSHCGRSYCASCHHRCRCSRP